jgi:hypothetical protein
MLTQFCLLINYPDAPWKNDFATTTKMMALQKMYVAVDFF